MIETYKQHKSKYDEYPDDDVAGLFYSPYNRQGVIGYLRGKRQPWCWVLDYIPSEKLWHFYEHLPPKQRYVFDEYCVTYGHASYEQLAKRLQMTEAAIVVSLSKIRKHLIEALLNLSATDTRIYPSHLKNALNFPYRHNRGMFDRPTKFKR